MTQMTIHNRSDFLSRIAKRLGRDEPLKAPVERPVYQVQPQKSVLANSSKDELIHILRKQCEVIHTDFYLTSKNELNNVLRTVIENYNGKTIVTQTDQRHEDFQMNKLFKELSLEGTHVHYWHPDYGKENQVIAEKADIGITFSDVTLSESGTVALFNNAYHGRSISLLPQTYIALIPKSTLVPRYTQLAEQLHEVSRQGDSVGSCVSLVTGPSNSADIEMKLIVGVHGPVKASYIVIEDA